MKTIASFFAGCGGIDLGFSQAKFKTLYANEFDKYPVATYEANFDLKVDNRDIRQVEAKDVPNVDVIVGGFPCQAFSTLGVRKGFNDPRGRLFFEMSRIIAEKKPSVVFFENVAGLVARKEEFGLIIDELKNLGYYVQYQLMNATQYANIPQNRRRVYIVGFKDKAQYERFRFPDKVELTTKIFDFIDRDSKVDDKYYIRRLKRSYLLEDIADDPESMYMIRYNLPCKKANNECFTLTASMAGICAPHFISKYGMRKITPREAFNLQGFPQTFKFVDGMSDIRLYKQAGNSVCVPVVRRIAEAIMESF